MPVLWCLGKFDARVSPDLFKEDGDYKLKQGEVQFYLANTGHWPMFEENGSEFDQKAIQWLNKISIVTHSNFTAEVLSNE